MSGGPARRRRRWEVRKVDSGIVGRLSADLGCHPVLARLLANRGLTTPEAASSFLEPRLTGHLRSPMLFRDMPRAAERVVDALRRGERIGVYGDYDVDGISGSALLLRFFRALGHEPELYIPHRLRDGYGLNAEGVRRLAAAGCRLMITVDCGAVSHGELRLSRELGMDAIVCDHHQVSAEPLPVAAVLNPVEPDAGFPFRGLCGAGVAFYLAMGVRMLLRPTLGDRVPDLRRCLDLVALGTIADLVPLREENRVLVKRGLEEIACSRHPGLQALKAVSGVTDVSAGAVGYRLAPRLNAGGRLSDARVAVELLTEEDVDEARRLAARLDDENRQRQELERRAVAEAIDTIERGGQVNRLGLVVASADWHPGVVGIVASRLVDRYYRPAVVIALDRARGLARGSGRSIRGVDLHGVLQQCADLLEGFGGHPMAAGLTVKCERVEALAARFDAAVRDRTTEADFVPRIEVDAEIELRDLDERLMADLERLEPHGVENREPLFFTRAARVARVRRVGRGHLRLDLEADGRSVSAIGFGQADEEPGSRIAEGDRIDALHTPCTNGWNGMSVTELRIRDLRLAT